MVVNKRKKNVKQRGTKTHGYGSMKKHRGAGSRGGRGRAGSGKKGDSQKPSLLWKKGEKYKGKTGFYSVKRQDIKTITIGYIEAHKAKFNEENGILDLTKLGYHKLLSNGKAVSNFKIKIDTYSTKAKEKLEAVGGLIVEKKVAKPEPKKE